MENKHTPGQWKATKKEGNHIIHSDSEANCLAIVGTGIFNSDPLKFNEAEANARLIAAAPDLLKALQKTLENIEARIKYFKDKEGENSFNAGVFEAIVNIHKEAINKATQQ